MLQLTERLIKAYLRRDNIPAILKAKLASKSSTEQLFLLTAAMDELTSENGTYPLAAETIKKYIQIYLKGLTNGT